MITIWLRGAVIVTLVSLNTRLLADGRWTAVIVATALSAVWWINARTASKVEGWRAMLAYAVGAGCGTALGLWLGGL
jgi:hypothetical protein